MSQYRISHVNKSPRMVVVYGPPILCKQIGCGSKPHFSTSEAPQLAVETKAKGYSYTIGYINRPQDVTSTKQLLLPLARKTRTLEELNVQVWE